MDILTQLRMYPFEYTRKAADEIERLREQNELLQACFMEAVKQIAKSDPAGVKRWLREQGL